MSIRGLRSLCVASLFVALVGCSATASRSLGSEDATVTSSSEPELTTTTGGDATTTVAVTLAPAATTAATVAPTVAPVTAAPVTSAASTGPQVVSATFSGPSACTATDVSVDLPPASVRISWVATNADSVYVSIDNPYGPYEQNLPLTGSISGLPFGCPGSHTYYVVAVKGAERSVKSKTFTAD